jgi:hypothetical protein
MPDGNANEPGRGTSGSGCPGRCLRNSGFSRPLDTAEVTAIAASPRTAPLLARRPPAASRTLTAIHSTE